MRYLNGFNLFPRSEKFGLLCVGVFVTACVVSVLFGGLCQVVGSLCRDFGVSGCEISELFLVSLSI